MEIDAFLGLIEAFLNGNNVLFALDILRLDLCSCFQQKVLLSHNVIPRGRVSAYSLIAKHIGSPDAARAVGTVTAANPFPLVIHCHRVIRLNGTCGGYLGGSVMKRALLQMEGITFSPITRTIPRDLFFGFEHETNTPSEMSQH